jgi:hypothetical protein
MLTKYTLALLEYSHPKNHCYPADVLTYHKLSMRTITLNAIPFRTFFDEKIASKKPGCPEYEFLTTK